MASFVEKALGMGYDLDNMILHLSPMKPGEKRRIQNLDIERDQYAFIFTSEKGMMRVGKDLDRLAVSVAVISLG